MRLATLQRLSCFSFLDSSYKKQGVVQRLRGSTPQTGDMCLFYGFYYIKYIKRYTGKYTDRYIFEEMC